MVNIPVDRIDGYPDVVSWFGRWPSFHDGEIVQIDLTRGRSYVHVSTFRKTSELEYATVIFVLERVTDIALEGFNHQNVVFGIDVEPAEAGVKLVLHPCFGVSGSIEAESLGMKLIPASRLPPVEKR